METLSSSIRKTIIIVVDSLGVGVLPDSLDYENERTINTLSNVAEKSGQLDLPNLVSLGLGNVTYVKNVARNYSPVGFFGKIKPESPGLEKLIAYWEMTGIVNQIIPSTLLEELPEEIYHKFQQSTQKEFTGGSFSLLMKAIKNNFSEHYYGKKPIINISPEGAVQIACHTDVMSVEELYRLCFSLRRICDKHKILRLMAVPFIGEAPPLLLKDQQKTFSMPAPQVGILEALSIRDIPVYSIGNTSDYFNELGFWETYKLDASGDKLLKGLEILKNSQNRAYQEVIFIEYNFDYYESSKKIDKTISYAAFLEGLDKVIPDFISLMNPRDILIITGDQPSDPSQNKHIFTREYVPILLYSKTFKPYDFGNLGIRKSLSDIALSLAEMYDFALPYMKGESFWKKVSSQV